ncbi:ATP-binding protein [Sanguibacteroides justesenii]|uniref:ATP-binding protein n=1 Tax=Sanguibacteroides justesenii TaxID=1547597 RepID=A0A0C3R3R2_9PORP|nr:ATP-binding protein [Sanguibacteroides justesenii]KIO43870.1 hypothetical protein BA92_10725 [Sanguibacteroides justesenii]
MDINVKQAVKLFFANPSLEMVFFEAIANAIDADATDIKIQINLDEFNKPDTLTIKIIDNGVGLTDERFGKFSELLKVDEDTHKGVGRLVFLSYFKRIAISSTYEKKHRTFTFSNDFDGKSNVVDIDSNEHGTTLTYEDYYLKKIKSHDYLRPSTLKLRILEEFYPRLYLLKQEGRYINISISLTVNVPNLNQQFTTSAAIIDTSKMETLSVVDIDAEMLDLFEKMKLHYLIKQKESDNTIITAICVDGRTYKMDIIAPENIPYGYDLIFLLYSDLFKGQVNASRQELTMKDATLKTVKTLFRKKVAELLNLQIPTIKERNAQIKDSFYNRFPHLLDYFENDTIGFISRNDAIRNAQEKFFKDQKEVLDATDFSDERYEKTLEMSARTLTEYILYRQIIIDRLKNIDTKNREEDIHNLIVPKRKLLSGQNFITDIYNNNAWLLDDKYMTYSTILSERDMSELVDVITEGEVKLKDDSRPDIAIVFSGNPNDEKKNTPVDVVIIELKKKGLKLAKNEEVISQLRQRARRLMKYYNNKIQRIWFYGIIEFSTELKISMLEDKFNELFSNGSVFYKEIDVMLDYETKKTIPAGIFLMEFNSFIADADTRNSTFLKVLKSHFTENRDIDNTTTNQ